MQGRPKFRPKDEPATFDAFINGASTGELAKMCNCAYMTMHGFLERNKWAIRRDKLLKKVERKLDEDKSERMKRQVALARKMQEKGEGALDQATTEKISPSIAVTAIVEGIRIEREVLGDDSEKQKPQQIELVLSPEFAKMMGVSRFKTVDSTVIESEAKGLPSPDGSESLQNP
jgi:hypothetical protein